LTESVSFSPLAFPGIVPLTAVCLPLCTLEIFCHVLINYVVVGYECRRGERDVPWDLNTSQPKTFVFHRTKTASALAAMHANRTRIKPEMVEPYHVPQTNDISSTSIPSTASSTIAPSLFPSYWDAEASRAVPNFMPSVFDFATTADETKSMTCNSNNNTDVGLTNEGDRIIEELVAVSHRHAERTDVKETEWQEDVGWSFEQHEPSTPSLYSTNNRPPTPKPVIAATSLGDEDEDEDDDDDNATTNDFNEYGSHSTPALLTSSSSNTLNNSTTNNDNTTSNKDGSHIIPTVLPVAPSATITGDDDRNRRNIDDGADRRRGVSNTVIQRARRGGLLVGTRHSTNQSHSSDHGPSNSQSHTNNHFQRSHNNNNRSSSSSSNSNSNGSSSSDNSNTNNNNNNNNSISGSKSVANRVAEAAAAARVARDAKDKYWYARR
jgi:hypothetical protein